MSLITQYSGIITYAEGQRERKWFTPEGFFELSVYSIPDGKLLAGLISPPKEKLVVAWIEIHQDDLLADWELAVNGKTPFKIKGLDQ